jgi:EAL and modified HD-GYP domain-containing signal transduction protein
MLVRRAKRRDLSVLARGVDRSDDFEGLRESGFDFFQGQHYADEKGSDQSRNNVDTPMLLDLMLEARAGLDLAEVSRRIEAHPHLTEGLLQLVNGLELARAHKIDSVHQALIMIGADGLGRWLNLLLFRYGAAGGERGPLFRVAASRARLMELLITEGLFEDPDVKEKGETAFLVGMLSLVHVLLGEPAHKTVEGLGLSAEMRTALLDQQGPIGRVLATASGLDSGRFADVAEVVAELEIEPAQLWRHQRDAYSWVYQMT